MQDVRPPRNVIRFVNPVMKALLRSPLHRLVSRKLMLLTVTGRKTGRTYTVPVGRHELPDGSFILSAGGNWRHNLRGGADVRITLDGRERAGHALLEEDIERAAEAFKTMLDRAGPRALSVKVNVDRSPTAAEIKPVLTARGVAYLQLVE
ncbi:MAG: mycobacterial cell wall protein Rv0580c [Thermoleophilaceae bacterium]